MQPEPKKAAASADTEAVTICPNCHVPMPSAMRFCRSCGFRLGEGVAEYAETMRLHNQANTGGSRSANTASRSPQTGATAYGQNAWAPIAPVAQGAAQPFGQASARLGACRTKGGRRRAPWIVWVVLGVTVASVTTGGLLSPFGLRNRIRTRTAASAAAARSMLGLESLKTTTGGVTFDYVYPPGGAADKAGLVGGDIITSFDGQTVMTDDQLTKLLAATPIGKTVEVVYIRDGQTNRTQLTTISADERARLKALFENRPEGQGFLGIEDWERVAVPGTNIYGVQLTDVAKNRPGYIAGLRDGDIVIEFAGIPIRTSRELVARIERTVPDSVVKIVVMRGGERLEIPVKIGVD
jgi:S1-C subfamily serine protease